jgi:hypothetical protein
MAQKLSGTILISESLGIENTNNFNTKYFNIKQEKMTAVEWLFMTLALTPMTDWYNVLEKAKSMEKEQIRNAYNADFHPFMQKDFEQYYNETYNK